MPFLFLCVCPCISGHGVTLLLILSWLPRKGVSGWCDADNIFILFAFSWGGEGGVSFLGWSLHALGYVTEKGLFGKGDEDCVFLFFFLSILSTWQSSGYLHCEWDGCNSIADGPEQRGRIVGLLGMGCRVCGVPAAGFLAIGTNRHKSLESLFQKVVNEIKKDINHLCYTREYCSAWSVSFRLENRKRHRGRKACV